MLFGLRGSAFSWERGVFESQPRVIMFGAAGGDMLVSLIGRLLQLRGLPMLPHWMEVRFPVIRIGLLSPALSSSSLQEPSSASRKPQVSFWLQSSLGSIKVCALLSFPLDWRWYSCWISCETDLWRSSLWTFL